MKDVAEELTRTATSFATPVVSSSSSRVTHEKITSAAGSIN